MVIPFLVSIIAIIIFLTSIILIGFNKCNIVFMHVIQSNAGFSCFLLLAQQVGNVPPVFSPTTVVAAEEQGGDDHPEDLGEHTGRIGKGAADGRLLDKLLILMFFDFVHLIDVLLLDWKGWQRRAHQ